MSTLIMPSNYVDITYNNLINMRLTSKCQDRLQLRFIHVDFNNAF